METESASNEEENNEQNKRDHIKERLKEMGVSQDSVRPDKSWLSRNVNYLILGVVVVLVAAFVIEYQSSNKMEAANTQVAEKSPATKQAGNAYYYNQPSSGMMGMEMQAPSWAQPQYGATNLSSGNTNNPGDQSEGQTGTKNSVENNTDQNGNYGWYAQQRFYGRPQYYGQAYQQPPVQNQANPQSREQRGWSDNRQPTYSGQYNGQYNGNGPAYNPYYVPMPNPYSMPYPATGYYNGWYR